MQVASGKVGSMVQSASKAEACWGDTRVLIWSRKPWWAAVVPGASSVKPRGLGINPVWSLLFVSVASYSTTQIGCLYVIEECLYFTYFQINNTIFKDKSNLESNIGMGLVYKSFKITKQKQKQIKPSFFQLVADVWDQRSHNGFCNVFYKRFGSSHMRETAFGIQVLGAKWSAI